MVPPGVPHTLGATAPHDCPGTHVPHMSRPPHPSATGPQLAPAIAQVRGRHDGAPHVFATPPPPQVVPAAQVPHINSPPHPSDTGPQLAPSPAHVRRTQVLPASGAPPVPHTLGRPPPPHVVPAAQVPHINSPPQPSATGPQLVPAEAQVRRTHATPASVDPPLPHTLARPPPPQVVPTAQVPHISSPPHPSDTGPQLAPIDAQVRGTQVEPPLPGAPHTLGRPPPPQVVPAAQVPHISSPPHPSDTGPQLAPSPAHVRGTHAPLPPQRPGLPPPPQVCGATQVPHVSSPPQPSDTGPQSAPALAQVRRTHPGPASNLAPGEPQTLGIPPPPQVAPGAQAPHSRSPPHPSETGPQLAPAIAQVRGVQPDMPPQRLGIPPPPQVCGAAQVPH